jgi:endonuclease/exonuclease/phosphatase family metal-dependent hydrolase
MKYILVLILILSCSSNTQVQLISYNTFLMGDEEEVLLQKRLSSLEQVLSSVRNGECRYMCILLQEIADESTAQRIANRHFWLDRIFFKKPSVFFSKGVPMGGAIISNIPMNMKSHRVQVFRKGSEIRGRVFQHAILKAEDTSLNVWNIHLKSQREDGRIDQSYLRTLQWDRLSKLIDQMPNVIIAGDFNEDLALSTEITKSFDSLFLKKITTSASYMYKEKWLQLDAILIHKSLDRFNPAEVKIYYESVLKFGKPHRWDPVRFSGFSDHLPVSCTLSR